MRQQWQPFTADEQAEAARTQRYRQAAQEAAEKRNAFAAAGIRHTALGTTADALVRSEASLRPLQLGSIVRVSNVHLDKALRRAIKAGVKRAKDMVSWSADLYYVAAAPAHGPLQAAAGNADARPHY